MIDSDLSTITTQSDKVFHVADVPPWLAHIEIVASNPRYLATRTLRYNVLLLELHRLPVPSVLVLLCPQADSPELTGQLQHRLPTGVCYHEFRYQVVRAWELPVERLLTGALGVLPLAPISRVAAAELPDVVRRMGERLKEEPDPARAAELWTAASILMGLRYPAHVAGAVERSARHGRIHSLSRDQEQRQA